MKANHTQDYELLIIHRNMIAVSFKELFQSMTESQYNNITLFNFNFIKFCRLTTASDSTGSPTAFRFHNIVGNILSQ